MATQSRRNYIYRPETIRHTLVLGVGDTNGTTYKLSMAPGLYELAVTAVKTANFSHQVTIGSIKPFLDAEQTLVADTPLNIGDVDDASAVTVITIPTGTSAFAKYYAVFGSFGQALANLFHGPFAIPFGLQVTWTTADVLTTGSATIEFLTTRVA